MAKIIDIVGKKFNMLTVVEISHKNSRGRYYWKCVCECGNTHIVEGTTLKSGATKSCGCIKTTHNLTNHWFFKRWKAQYRRCNDVNDISYKNYGGRGIKCLWTLEEACKWADENKPPNTDIKYDCDRIDNDGHYCSENVRWATRDENNSNKRSNVGVGYYEHTPSTTVDFRKYCNKHGLDYDSFDKIFSGIKSHRKNKYFYFKKEIEGVV